MNYVIYLFGILFAAIGVTFIVAPQIVIQTLKKNLEKRALYILAISIRLILGIALLLAAEASKFPMALSVIGTIALLAAMVLMLIGHTRFKNLMAWVLEYSTQLYFAKLSRISGAVAIVLGIFLIVAAT